MTTKTRRITGLVGLLIATFVSVYTYNSTDKQLDSRSRYNQFLDNHPFSNVLSDEELAALPKYDRPDLAMQQDYLSMVDPNTLTVPYERTIEAFEYTRRRLAAKSAFGQNGFQLQLNSNSRPKSGKVMMEPPSGAITLSDGESFEAITVDGNEVVWEEQGPTNVGGRTRAIIWDPNDPTNRAAFAGGVSGGLWYNTNVLDPNSSWTPIDDFMANLAITTLAVDPTDPDVIYAGTGEGFFNADAVRGVGIFKSTDGGSTWSLLSSTEVSDFAYVNKIVVTSTGVVLAATRGSSTDGGIYRSADGGMTWVEELAVDGADIEIAANGDIYASRGLIFSAGSVSKSTDGGLEWTDVTPDADPDEDPERIELATAPSNANVVYAMAQDGVSRGIDWVQKSTDGGATWTNLPIPTHNDGCAAEETNIARNQAWYDLILAVAPENENVVIAGGVDLARSDDGGASWTQISEWFDCSSVENVHADQHQIVFRPDNPNEALFGTDGGVYYSPNVSIATAPSFESRNKNYAVTQFYAVATDNVAGSEYFIAGAQDNGTQQLSTGSGGIAVEVVGGDGAYCHVDQLDRTYQIASTQNGGARHSVDGGLSFARLTTISGANFINQTDYDNSTGILYSTANADQYGVITGLNTTSPSAEVGVDVDFGGRQTSAIRANTNTDNRIFVGTEGGLVFRIDNANSTPTLTNITSNISTVGTVSSIDIGASDNELIVTYSNFGVASVWYTADGGSTWVNKDDDHGLPDIPVRWVLFNPNNTAQVMLATELGVWSTNDITATNPGWEPSNAGLANVKCHMLQYRESDGLVVVGTHGRGIFTTNIFSATQDEAGPVAQNFTPADDETSATSLDGELEIQFNEAITKGTGNVVLRLAADDAIVETIDVTSDQVLTAGLTATINPTDDLVANTSYYVEVDAGAFEDNLGNAFAGISGSETWNFTTFDGDLAPVVLIPIPDQEIDENSSAVVVDLSNTFSDQDNDNSAITKELISNSNDLAVTVSVSGDDLTITPIADRIGQATVVVRATSNGKTVDDTFVITIESIAEELFVQTNAGGSGFIEGVYTDDSDGRNVDDFVVPGGQNWSISTVTTEAFSLGDADLDMQSVEVTIYADSDGAPDQNDIVHTEDVLVGSGSIIGGSTGSPSLTVRLASAVDLTPGTYWLSIHPTFNVDGFTETGAFNAIYVWFISGDDGNAFEEDENGDLVSLGEEFMFSVDGEAEIFDFGPEVANAIADVDLTRNPSVNPTLIDISDVFTDPDDDDTGIAVEVVGNTNTDLVTTALADGQLSLTIAEDGVGLATITLRATSNSLTVDESFNITVLYEEELYSQSGAQVGTTPSQTFPDFGNFALESADAFSVPDGEVWEVGEVSVVGSGASPAQAFFYIYEDAGGVPGDIIYFSGVLPTLYTTDNTDFILSAATPADLIAGDYWISVQTFQSFGDSGQWFWVYTSPSVGDNYAIQDVGQLLGGSFPASWALSGNDGALVFTLSGGEVAAAPLSPSDLSINYDGTDISLTWTDNSEDEISFIIERSDDGGAFEEVGTTTGTTYSSSENELTPIEPNTEYSYRVIAEGASSFSGYSNVVSQLTIGAAPTDIDANEITSTTMAMSWVADDGSTDFEVDVSTDNFTTFEEEDLAVAGTSLTLTELSSNTAYQIRIQSVNAAGTSAESEVFEVSTLAASPSGLEVSGVTATSFDLAWASADNATSFSVDVSVDNFETFVSEDTEVSGATTLTVDGLTANSTYQVRVQAVNTSGSSVESEATTVLTLPSAPSELVASNVGETSFDVSWTDADNLSDYRVDISTDDFTTFVSENTTSTTATFSVAELTSNTTYQVRVQTVNATGSSAESDELAVVTLPVAPTATEGTDITGVSFTANWTTADGATTFELDVSQDDFETFVGDFESFEVTGTSASVTGLTEGNYVFRVRATNASGGSTYSNTVAVEVEEPLSVDELVGNITVYPNPSAGGIFNLDYQQINNKPLLVKVYSILGREILSVDFSEETNRFVDLSNQPNGTLIMEIIRGDVKRSVVLMKR